MWYGITIGQVRFEKAGGQLRKTDQKQGFVQGAMILMIGTVTVKVVSRLFKIPISNMLGGTGYSYFTNAYEIFNLISTIATAGFPVAISKLVSENSVLGRYRDSRKIFRISRLFFLLTGFLCMVVMILGAGTFAAMIPNPGARLSIICLAPAVLTCCLMSAYRGYYQGMQNMYPTSISQIIEAVTKMIFGLGLSGAVLYLTQREYETYGTVLGQSYAGQAQAQAVIAQLASGAAVLGVSLSTAAGLLYLMIRWRKKGDGVPDELVRQSPQPQRAGVLFKTIIVIAVPVCLGSLAVNFSGIIDLMTVTGRLAEVMQTAPQALLDCYGANIPEAEIINNSVHNYLYGAYSGKAVVIANLVPALTAGLAVSALPVVAESFAQGNRLRTQRSVQMVLRITTIVCIPAGMGISALAQEVCELFFGYNSEVAIGAPLLQVLAIASIFIALTAAINSLLQAVGRVSLPVKLILIGSLVKLAMNYILVGIPQINIQAAPWSTLACYLLVTVLSLIALRQSVGELGVVSVFVKPLLAGLLCAAFARLSQNLISTVIASRFAVLVSVAVGALVYLIALFLLKAFKKEDIEMLPKGEKIAKTLEKYSLLG